MDGGRRKRALDCVRSERRLRCVCADVGAETATADFLCDLRALGVYVQRRASQTVVVRWFPTLSLAPVVVGYMVELRSLQVSWSSH